MRRFRSISTILLLGALAGWLGACSTDSPSAPSQTPTNPVPPAPPPPPGPTTSVTVTVSPGTLGADSTSPATVTVRVSRSDGASVDNATVTLTTTLGAFGSATGAASTNLDLVNGQATAFIFPTGVAGVATLRASVTFPGTTTPLTGSANLEFRAPAEFFVSSLEPNQGSPDGGTTVTINGGGFRDPVRVTFDGVPGIVQSVSGSRIVVVTPRTTAPTSELPKAVSVAVTIRANQPDAKTDVLASGFIYSAGGTILQPRILSITPTTGPNDGGTRITINGDGFESPLQVLFTGPSSGGGGAISLEAAVISTSRTQVVVLSPAASGFGGGFVNQDVLITVKNLSSGLQADATQKFHYGSKVHITSMGPGSGPFTGGTRVTIFGSGFAGPVAVSLGGVGQAVLNVTGSEIIFQTSGINVTTCPANGIFTATPISVTNIDTGDSDSQPISFSYVVPVPLIFGISPNAGATNTSATISGQNFAANVQVLFGGTNGSAATVVSHTSTSINIKVPPTPPGFTFNTEACDGNGDGVPSGTRPIPTPASISVINLDGTGCVGTLSNAFTLTPSSNACSGDTSVPPPPQCSDGIDNDLDGLTDFGVGPGFDPQCTSAGDTSEAS